MKILKGILIIFGGLFALLLVVAIVSKKPTTSNAPSSTEVISAAQAESTTSSTPAAEPQEEVYKTTAKQLFLDYEENEVATDNKIEGKKIEVTGVIESIDKDFAGDIVVKLSTGSQFNSAQLELAESEKTKAAELKKNKKISFTCEKFTRIMSSPMGDGCVIN